jgi:hypothetical protein
MRSPEAALTDREAQRRMARDYVEVGVLAKQLRIVANGHGGDQAIGELARCLAPLTAEPVKLSGLLIVGGTVDGEELQAMEQAPQPIAVSLIASAGKDLHDDHVRARQSDLLLQSGAQSQVGRLAVARRNSTQAELSTRELTPPASLRSPQRSERRRRRAGRECG